MSQGSLGFDFILFSSRLCNTRMCVNTLALKKYLSFKTWEVQWKVGLA